MVIQVTENHGVEELAYITLTLTLIKKGLLKVPGRMKKSSLHLDNVHPVLPGKNGNITRLTVKWCHKKMAHAGKGLIMIEIRCNGFRVVRCSTTVRSLIGKCHMPITAR